MSKKTPNQQTLAAFRKEVKRRGLSAHELSEDMGISPRDADYWMTKSKTVTTKYAELMTMWIEASAKKPEGTPPANDRRSVYEFNLVVAENTTLKKTVEAQEDELFLLRNTVENLRNKLGPRAA